MRIKSPPHIAPYAIGKGRVGRDNQGSRHNNYAASHIGWYSNSNSACGNSHLGRTRYTRPRFTILIYGMDKNMKVGSKYIGRIHNAVKC